jgi:hypothetical protein
MATRAFRDVDIVIAKQPAALIERRPEERLRTIQLPELLIHAAERLIELRLHHRLGVQTPRFLHAAIEQRDDAQFVGGASGFVAAAEEIQHEPLDSLGACGFGHGRVCARSSDARYRR